MDVFTMEETSLLILSALTESGEMHEEDIDKILQWATEARVAALTLEAVLNRHMAVTVREGELMFRVTDEGRRAAGLSPA